MRTSWNEMLVARLIVLGLSALLVGVVALVIGLGLFLRMLV